MAKVPALRAPATDTIGSVPRRLAQFGHARLSDSAVSVMWMTVRFVGIVPGSGRLGSWWPRVRSVAHLQRAARHVGWAYTGRSPRGEGPGTADVRDRYHTPAGARAPTAWPRSLRG